ncbi:hypothetical protein Rsub_07042 [Raphidocelis subcapitata]|uniref:HAUS augmin-like complex subunit 3 N-terminal domain-containing protein n=1 Tax=Raphidocelis subcapitata TaxID=307507 RepID=A0A2V0P3S7_9CHLO|nr:hypothetical protein Rsub_07042 [Raphidocelis subcapitata]|eukprot:GBF94508.1 hypothetical protein Rsub_07042 [Raphidocelis subcapitata]
MASKLGKGRPGIHNSRLLQLLRKHGFADDLPPSTVSWLDSRPVFRWLAEHLDDENFVEQETQRLYESIQLQAGGGGRAGGGASAAAAQLMSAMGIASDTSSGENSGGSGEGRGGNEDDGWGQPSSVEELEAAIEAQQAHMELLQRQLASVGAESRRLASAASAGPGGAAQQRRALLSSLRAAQLRAAAAGAAEAGRELDGELAALASEAAEWGARAEGADRATGDWLLCTADASAYAARDAEAQELISRGMQLVNAAAGVAPPPGAEDSDDFEEDGAADTAAAGAASWAPGARRGDARRWRDQERRNEGLRAELSRQRAAFKAAYDAHMAATAKRAGAEGALAAVEALLEAERRRGGGGGGARAAAAGGAEGVEAVLQQAPQLRREAEALERERLLLQEAQLPALHAELARLNDTHVLRGDYERQLRKMAVAHDRKRALIDALLDAAARAAALQELRAGELRWLRGLGAQVDGVRALLDALARAAAARQGAYAAAGAAAAAAAARSSLAAEDVFASRVQQLLQPGSADWAAVRAGGDGFGAAAGAPQQQQQQPRPGGGMRGLITPPHGGGSSGQSPHLTPRSSARAAPSGFASIRDLAGGLSSLAASLASCEASISGGLFSELPRRMGELPSAERRLRALAFPGGAGGCAGAGAGAPPAPVLTAPPLADAMRALEALNQSVGASINRLLQQQQDWVTIQKQHAREQSLERRVMALAHADPQRLAAEVRALRERVRALEAAGGGAGGGAAP